MTCALDVHKTHMWNAYLSNAINRLNKSWADKDQIVSLTIGIEFGKRQNSVLKLSQKKYPTNNTSFIKIFPVKLFKKANPS